MNKKSLFQASIELLLTMTLNKVVSLEEHCCLADLGILFSTLTIGICASIGDGGGDVDAGDAGDAGDVDSVAGGEPELGNVGNGAGGLGSLPDPGHLAVTGPWVLSRPVEMMENDLRHTAHVCDAIFVFLVIIITK